MNIGLVGKILDGVIAGAGLLKGLGVNLQEVFALQDQADAEGRELTAEERQRFLDQAQSAIDRL